MSGEILDSERIRRRLAFTIRTQAQNAFGVKELQRSIELFTRAINLSKNNSCLYLDRATVYLSMNMFDHVIADCKESLKIRNSGTVWLLMGRVYSHMNNEVKYIECLEAHNKYEHDMYARMEQLADNFARLRIE